MAWTAEQEKAIHSRGHNIMVSAGAGSGKTAVLSERVLEYCKNLGDVRKLLVLTFTNAAAKEMKERIRNKLLNYKTDDLKVLEHLKKQSEYIDAAYITTFDSYALSLVKKYGYIINVDNNVEVISNTLIDKFIDDLIDETLKKYIINDNEYFYFILDFLTDKDIQPLKSYIKSIIEFLRLKINVLEYYNNFDYYLSKKFKKDIIDEFISHFFGIFNMLKEKVNLFREQYATYKTYNIKKQRYENNILSSASLIIEQERYEIVNKVETYDDLFDVLNISKMRKSNKWDENLIELNDEINFLIDELKIINEYGDLETIEAGFANNHIKKFLLDIAYDIYLNIFEYEKSLNKYDFSDIAKLSLKILENKEIANELKYYFNEILVDEYQDTSDIQEAFLNIISNNNLYMVGDIKQSIYRFRNANPYIFKDKYLLYQNDPSKGEKIDLVKNFRSRPEVLNCINKIFNNVMSLEYGDADYSKSHQMVFGNQDFELAKELDKFKYDYNFEVLRYDESDGSNFSKPLREAYIVADDIINKMNFARSLKGKKRYYKDEVINNSDLLDIFKRYGYYDKLIKDGFIDLSESINIRYSDFAILIKDSKSFKLFKDVLESKGINVYIDAKDDLKASDLLYIFKNIINIIYQLKNKDFDNSFKQSKVSILRSFIYGMDDYEIFNVINNNLKTKFDDDFYYLSNLDNISYSMLFDEIIKKLDIYENLIKTDYSESGIVILDEINKIMKNFDSCSFDLIDVRDSLIHQLNGKSKLEYNVSNESKDAVVIMTIHRSKGLEFPYCYFPILDKKPNYDKSKIKMSNDFGMILPHTANKYKSILKFFYILKNNNEELSELIRLFYVALTRAKEKIIFIKCDKSNKKEFISDVKTFNDLLDIIDGLDLLDEYSKVIDITSLNIEKVISSSKNKISNLRGKKIIEFKEVKEIKEIKQSRISKQIHDIPTDNVVNNINLGLEFHKALELLDFKTQNVDILPTTDFIKSKIKELLKNDIFKNIKNAKTYHEYEFSRVIDGISYNGIIDLLVEYDTHFEIIDYKLKNTIDDAYIRQLNLYKSYINQVSKKDVKMYLLSILDNKIKEVL